MRLTEETELVVWESVELKVEPVILRILCTFIRYALTASRPCQ